jgi:hypothetical protein
VSDKTPSAVFGLSLLALFACPLSCSDNDASPVDQDTDSSDGSCGDGICDRTEDCRSCFDDCGYCCPLAESYNCETYHFPEPKDEVSCSGAGNSSARIEHVQFAQTHLFSPDWPLFFLIAGRPALLSVAVVGTGGAPEVSVEGFLDGKSIGVLCLAGPKDLSTTVDIDHPSRDDRFTVTLPKSWLQPGLSLSIAAGKDARSYDQETLKVGHAPELNLVVVPFDILNYNDGKEDIEVPSTLLGDFAGAIPATVSRLAHFPGRISLPEMIVTREDAVTLPVRITKRKCGEGESPGPTCENHGIADGNLNAVALRFTYALQKATGEFAYSAYYGNTENFNPGGWGGGKAFVAADYGGVFIHEFGHTLSLPHWGSAYNITNPEEHQYNYPYGGIDLSDGGGRGDTWNYYQNVDELVSPLCLIPDHELFGSERSDAMQRNHYCTEMRATGQGPWDGFGDFSALAMFRMLTGGEAQAGTVPYKQAGGEVGYQVQKHGGWPNLTRASTGERKLVRSPHQPQEKQAAEKYDFLYPKAWDVPVYTVFGTYHPEGLANNLNIIYEPITYSGTLPAIIDPTFGPTFAKLLVADEEYEGYFWGEKDLTFKFIYADGSELHALYPYDGVSRQWEMAAHPWRWDLLYFAINIPADKQLDRIELYERPFCVRHADINDEGNIANPNLNITADNYMDGATLVAFRDL